jgi:hypothetical protein
MSGGSSRLMTSNRAWGMAAWAPSTSLVAPPPALERATGPRGADSETTSGSDRRMTTRRGLLTLTSRQVIGAFGRLDGEELSQQLLNYYGATELSRRCRRPIEPVEHIATRRRTWRSCGSFFDCGAKG